MFLIRIIYRLYLLGAYLGLLPALPPAATSSSIPWTPVIGVGLRQGRRLAMEDRVAVVTQVTPASRSCPSRPITYAAIYDGHEGSRACDSLMRTLHPHVWAHVQRFYPRRCSLHSMELLQALLVTFRQLNTAFLQQAAARRWEDGSTAVVALLAGDQLLVASVGNSKALLCKGSRPTQDTEDGAPQAGQPWEVTALTHDHHPGKPQELQRCEAAGAHVTRSAGGKYRLMGELEVSRSFGDVAYQDKGVIPDLDFTLVNLTAGEDQLLLLTSDGVLEEVSPEEVCQQVWAEAVGDTRVTLTHPRPPPILLPGVAVQLPPTAGDSSGADSAPAGSSNSRKPVEVSCHNIDCTPLAHPRPTAAPGASSGAAGNTTYCCDCWDTCSTCSSSSSRMPSPTTGGKGAVGPWSCITPAIATFGVAPHNPKVAAATSEAAEQGPTAAEPRISSSDKACGYSSWQPMPLTLPQAATARLLQEAYNRGSMDNMAVIAIDLQPFVAGAAAQVAPGSATHQDAADRAQQGIKQPAHQLHLADNAAGGHETLEPLVLESTPRLTPPAAAATTASAVPASTGGAGASQPSSSSSNSTELQLAAPAIAGLVLLAPEEGVEYVLQKELLQGPSVGTQHAHVCTDPAAEGSAGAAGMHVEGHWDARLVAPAASEGFLLPEHSLLSDVAQQLLLPGSGVSQTSGLLEPVLSEGPTDTQPAAAMDSAAGADAGMGRQEGSLKEQSAIMGEGPSAKRARSASGLGADTSCSPAAAEGGAASEQQLKQAQQPQAGQMTAGSADAATAMQPLPRHQVMPADAGGLAQCALDAPTTAAALVVRALAAVPLAGTQPPHEPQQQHLLGGRAVKAGSSAAAGRRLPQLPAAAAAPAQHPDPQQLSLLQPVAGGDIPAPPAGAVDGLFAHATTAAATPDQPSMQLHQQQSQVPRQEHGRFGAVQWGEVLLGRISRSLLSKEAASQGSQPVNSAAPGRTAPGVAAPSADVQHVAGQRSAVTGSARPAAQQQARGPGRETVSATSSSRMHAHYRIGEQFGRGHFGEVWRAVHLRHAAGNSMPHQRRKHHLALKGIRSALLRALRLPAWPGPSPASSAGFEAPPSNWEARGEPPGDDGGDTMGSMGWPLVVKRVPGDKGEGVRRSGLREAYFGRLLQQEQLHICCKLASYVHMVHVQHLTQLAGPVNCSIAEAAAVCGRVLQGDGMRCNHSVAAAAAAAYIHSAAASTNHPVPAQPEHRAARDQDHSSGAAATVGASTAAGGNRVRTPSSGKQHKLSSGSRPGAGSYAASSPPAPAAGAAADLEGPCTWAAVVLGHQHLVQFEDAWETDEPGAGVSDTPTQPADTGSGPSEGRAQMGAGGAGGTAPVSAGDVWLVFQDAGRSLHSLLYEPVVPGTEDLDPQEADTEPREPAAGPAPAGDANGSHGTNGSTTGANSSSTNSSTHSSSSGNSSSSSGGTSEAPTFTILGPSRWWRAVRRSSVGHAFVRHIMRQMLLAVQAVHTANTTHRDLKPENLLFQVLAQAPAAAGAARARPSPAGTQGGDCGGEGATSADPAGRRGMGGGRSTPAATPTATSTTSSSSSSKEGAHAGPRLPPVGAGCGDKHTPAPPPPLHPDPLHLHLRVIDFGSSVDLHTLVTMYGTEGPSLAEVTLEYAPPEVLFSSKYHYNPQLHIPRGQAHDIWSVGVVVLELVMGTPHVFQLPPATRAALDVKLQLQGKSAVERHLLYLLRGMMELCIYPPQVHKRPTGRRPPGNNTSDTFGKPDPTGPTGKADNTSTGSAGGRPNQQQQQQQQQSGPAEAPLVTWSCTDEALLRLIKQRDPLGVGLEGVVVLRLLQRLLHWHPQHRPTAAQALQHAYFIQTPPQTDTQQQGQPGKGDQASEAASRLLGGCSELPMGAPGWC